MCWCNVEATDPSVCACMGTEEGGRLKRRGVACVCRLALSHTQGQRRSKKGKQCIQPTKETHTYNKRTKVVYYTMYTGLIPLLIGTHTHIIINNNTHKRAPAVCIYVCVREPEHDYYNIRLVILE